MAEKKYMAGSMVRATVDITAAHLDFSVYRGGRVIKGGTWKTPKPFFQDLAGSIEPHLSRSLTLT